MNRAKYVAFAIYMSFFYGNCLSNLVDFWLLLFYNTQSTFTEVKVKNFVAYCVACILYQVSFPYIKWPFTNDIFRSNETWKLSIPMMIYFSFYGTLCIGITDSMSSSSIQPYDVYAWNRIVYSIPMSFFITGLLEYGGLFRYARLELLMIE